MNSAFFTLPDKISSIPHAISYLGSNETRRWMNILTLSSLANKPEIILQNAMIRGKMCELLAKMIGDAYIESINWVTDVLSAIH